MEILTLLLYSFIGSVAGLIGGLILLFNKDWAKSLASVSVPLAAGVLMALSFLDLLPEAVEEYGTNSFTVILIVFVVLFLVERFFFYFHHHSQDDDHSPHSHAKDETAVPLVILGDTIHNFLDGVVIGATFLVNPSLSLIVAFSTFLHEAPHELADFGILTAKGYTREKAFMINLLSSLATFPGAFLTYLYADKVEAGVGFLLALAAGFFMYVATTDFLPEAAHAPKKFIVRQAAFLLVGIFAVVLVRAIFPELGH